MLAVLKLCFLADKYRQQELCFSASQSKKVSVHSALRFGLSTVLVGRGILFSAIWPEPKENQKSPGFILDVTSDTMRGFGDRLVARFLLWDTM